MLELQPADCVCEQSETWTINDWDQFKQIRFIDSLTNTDVHIKHNHTQLFDIIQCYSLTSSRLTISQQLWRLTNGSSVYTGHATVNSTVTKTCKWTQEETERIRDYRKGLQVPHKMKETNMDCLTLSSPVETNSNRRVMMDTDSRQHPTRSRTPWLVSNSCPHWTHHFPN